MVSHLVRHRVRRPSALIVRLTVPTESDRFLDLFGPSLDLNRSRLSVIRPGRPLIHPQTQVQVLHHCASPWVWILAFRLSSLLVPEQDVVHFQSSLAPGSHVPPYSQPSGSQPEPFITIPPPFMPQASPPRHLEVANLCRQSPTEIAQVSRHLIVLVSVPVVIHHATSSFSIRLPRSLLRGRFRFPLILLAVVRPRVTDRLSPSLEQHLTPVCCQLLGASLPALECAGRISPWRQCLCSGAHAPYGYSTKTSPSA